jgi:hypothetical protein
MLRTNAILLLIVATATGCAAAHSSREVPSGIYDLTVRGEVDACSPTRRVGAMGAVGVVARDGLLNVAVPDGASDVLARVSLARAEGLHTEVAVDIDGCANASLVRSWTVTESAHEGFELVFAQRWIGLAGCAAARAMPGAPASDCAAEQTLEYRLMEACAAPCEVRVAAGAATCACD